MGKAKACKLAGLPRSSLYYAKKKCSYTPEKGLCEKIVQICRERPTYGYRRITAMLRRQCCVVNRKKVQRIMRLLGLLHHAPVHRPHWQIHKGKQAAETPDTYWQADMTKIWCGIDGWGYLFNILDSCSRGWMGYNFSMLCSTNESLLALTDALLSRAPETGTIIGLKLGTDGGSQYTSRKFVQSLALLGLQHEVSRRHTPEDNGIVESFHKTLKSEYIWPCQFASFAEAERAIKEAFHDYNCNRIHSALKYKTPNEYLMEVTGKGFCFEALKCVQE
jgi:putative transposase